MGSSGSTLTLKLMAEKIQQNKTFAKNCIKQKTITWLREHRKNTHPSDFQDIEKKKTIPKNDRQMMLIKRFFRSPYLKVFAVHNSTSKMKAMQNCPLIDEPLSCIDQLLQLCISDTVHNTQTLNKAIKRCIKLATKYNKSALAH